MIVWGYIIYNAILSKVYDMMNVRLSEVWWYDVCKIVWGWASRFWPELWTIKQGGRTSGLHICTCTLINKYCTLYIYCTCTNLVNKYCTLQLQIGASRAPRPLVIYFADWLMKSAYWTLHICKTAFYTFCTFMHKADLQNYNLHCSMKHFIIRNAIFTVNCGR